MFSGQSVILLFHIGTTGDDYAKDFFIVAVAVCFLLLSKIIIFICLLKVLLRF